MRQTSHTTSITKTVQILKTWNNSVFFLERNASHLFSFWAHASVSSTKKQISARHLYLNPSFQEKNQFAIVLVDSNATSSLKTALDKPNIYYKINKNVS